MRFKMLVFAMILIGGFVMNSHAQNQTKEMRMVQLKLNESQLKLDEASAKLNKVEARFKEAQALFAKGLYSKVELAQEEENYQSAKLEKESSVIALEKTRLDFLNRALLITLVRATLYRDIDGNKHAKLTIKNNSSVTKIIDQNNTYTSEEKAGLLTIENLVVKILLNSNLIGRPFEQRISVLKCGETRDVDFVLQKETETVTVEMAYNDTIVTLPVFLEKESSQKSVSIEAVPYSQEGELGSSVIYDLELEQYSDENQVYFLEARSLPLGCTFEFREAGEGGQRVSSIRFAQGVTVKNLKLAINLPREINKDSLNRRTTFFALAQDRPSQQRLADFLAKSQGAKITPKILDSIKVSYEALELTPRGRAEITINASNLFKKTKIGDPITFTFDLANGGTVPLDQIRVYLALPLDWTSTINPEKGIALEVEGKKRIEIEIIPAADVVPGDYEIKIEAKTLFEGQEKIAQYKTMRIQIEGKSNILIGAILLIVLIGLIGGVAVMTIRISRR